MKISVVLTAAAALAVSLTIWAQAAAVPPTIQVHSALAAPLGSTRTATWHQQLSSTDAGPSWEVCSPPSGVLDRPEGLALDAQGNMYVGNVNFSDDRVQKLSASCAPVLSWNKGVGGDDLGDPYGVVMNPNGNIDVTDYQNSIYSRIAEFSPSGKPVREWKVEGMGLAVDARGNLYTASVNSQIVTRLSPSGEAVDLGQYGNYGSGPGQFEFQSSTPVGLAVDPEGNIYVPDTGNDRIQKLSPTGAPLAQWGTAGTGAGQFDWPEGIALDAKGNIYVADTRNDRIQELSPAGQPLAQWGHTGTGAGEFVNPAAVAFDNRGNLYVADTGNNRIQKLSLGQAATPIPPTTGTTGTTPTATPAPTTAATPCPLPRTSGVPQSLRCGH